MKRLSVFLSFVALSGLLLTAQVPQKFHYQAVVRDLQTGLIANQQVSFRMSILAGDPEGDPVYVETHRITTNGVGLADLVVGEGEDLQGDLGSIPWGEEVLFLKVEADRNGGSAYDHLGTAQLISVPYALVSGNVASPTRKFTIQEEPDHPVDSALFEVRNSEGQTVFAVYPEGTRVYVLDEGAKGVKGGFAIGGFSRSAKGITQEYMRVTPDSIRLYFDNGNSKAVKGGFAIGGFSRSAKAEPDTYFELKPDSARFTLVSEQEGDDANALTVETRSSSGDPTANGRSLFRLTRHNYAIGHRAGEALTDGAGNIFLGYESGFQTTSGYGNIFVGEGSGEQNTTGSFNAYLGWHAGRLGEDGINNVAIGFAAGENNKAGSNNVFIGSDAGLKTEGTGNIYIGSGTGSENLFGVENIMIGAGAGQATDTSWNNIFIGNRSGRLTTGTDNIFFGNNAGLSNETGSGNVFLGGSSGQDHVAGSGNVFLGFLSGFENVSGSDNLIMGRYAGYHHIQGDRNVFIGNHSGEWNADGQNNVFIGTMAGFDNQDGSNNVFIGFEAGKHEQGDGKLLIDLNGRPNDQALIYGEFFNSKVRINSQLGIGRMPVNVALEVEGDAYKSDGNADWEVTSDARVKTEIREIENALEQIMLLRPVTFRYTDEWRQRNPGVEDKTYHHFVAQEFAQVFPESVHRGPESLEGDPDALLRMNSQPAQVVAVGAIQELVRENRAQQELIEKLMIRVSELEAALQSE